MALRKLNQPPSCHVCRLVTYRLFSSRNGTNSYIDEWQASIVKPLEFYEANAAHPKRKNYFYNIDLQGRVFLGVLKMKEVCILTC